jgi:hypothetical protein
VRLTLPKWPVPAPLLALGLLASCASSPSPARWGPGKTPASLCATAVQCHTQGLRWLRRDDDRADRRLRRLCQGKQRPVGQGKRLRRFDPYGPACLALGRSLEDDAPDRATALYHFGCIEADEPRTCRRLGEQRLEDSREEAVRYLARGCELGDDQSCLLAARQYQERAEAPGDIARSELLELASDAYKRACGLTGNRAVCETGAQLRTDALVAAEVAGAKADEERDRRAQEEAAVAATRAAAEERDAARWSSAKHLEFPVRLTTSQRCEDGVVDRFAAKDDLLLWIVFKDGELRASLASWNVDGRVRKGLSLEGARGGRSASLTGHLIRHSWVWVYELEATITRSARFRAGTLTTQYSTGDGNECISTTLIERRKPTR